MDDPEHERRLDNNLSAWQFTRIEVAGDRNCLFTAVALCLTWMSDGYSESNEYQRILETFLHDQQIVTALDIIGLAGKLREAVVNEWMGEHTSEYQAFLTSDQLKAEADRFLTSGQFSGELGDLVLLALANVLATPLFLFTSVPSLPTLTVMPTHATVISAQPV